jgi:hypothetical protein
MRYLDVIIGACLEKPRYPLDKRLTEPQTWPLVETVEED